ncbi:hypothetical protein [Clostridium perfringens]|uniref:Uncharacterized protein n=2 Tax=Clostridium perfringens TaxID=1502 RepID=A0A8H9R051_CLOPF|nr:hypothetical protein [Clostridium perfringens]MDU7943408.1 hypothetical protein [Streptococcus salivarius]MDU7977684.1 hypothetical protein [Clostridioides difficile]EDT15786.1 hypothetical protein AC3_A0104 [Clostridium perfringens E str. JGS1987]MBI6024918.1 hypothetical protein [Clostridium perfringens]MBI6048745.1 hypothetical protein [Clostridium perfringens]
MNINVDFKKLEKHKLSEDDLLVRELLNICSEPFLNIDSALDIIPKLRTKHLIKAYREIDSSENKELVDMSIFEYLKDNIESTPEINFEEDEIYV